MGSFIRNKKGMTLPVAVSIIAIVFLFTVIVLTLSDNLTKNVSYKVSRENSLQIAEAGYNRYMYYLNQDSSFYQNVDGIHIAGNGSEELGFVPESFDSDGFPLSYKLTTYKSGEKILGYYQITIKQPAVNEDLTVFSTGWAHDAPNIKRTVKVQIHKRSFAEYVDFCNESGEIFWTTGDIAEGPVFCNGDINIDGNPAFNDDVVAHGTIKKRAGSNPTFKGKVLTNQPEMVFPISNNDIISWGKSADGLRFAGRTCIMLDNNKLKIRNKNVNGDNLTIYDLPACGVLLVENGGGSNNGDVFISGTLDGKLTVYAQGNVYITGKDPTNFTPGSANITNGIFYKDKTIPTKASMGTNYSDDMLGIVSENNIVIATRTWPSSGGLKTYSEKDVSVNNITVYGALMTSKAGKQIYVEYYDSIPAKGKFEVVGSKIQNAVRGAVGTFYSGTGTLASGYNKVNTFDYRLKTSSPPHFVEPAKSGWEVRSWEEVPKPQ